MGIPNGPDGSPDTEITENRGKCFKSPDHQKLSESRIPRLFDE